MRVIAGRLRGRRLLAPHGLTTRPTTDRVRQALFDVLGSVERARVLDLWAGTGALGIEALSRGAASAVFVESNRGAAAALGANVIALGLEESTRLLEIRVERATARINAAGPFDLVFCDPPWSRARHAAEIVERLIARSASFHRCRVVFEHRRGTLVDLGESGATVGKTRHWGDTAVTFFGIRPPSR